MQCLIMAGKKSGNFVMKIDWQKYISTGTLTVHRLCSSCLQLPRTQVFQEVLFGHTQVTQTISFMLNSHNLE